MKKKHTGRSGKREKMAERIVEYTKNHNSGVSMDSYMVRELQELARRVKEGKRRVEAVLDDLIALALTTDEFKLLQTIPSVKAKSAVSIVAEIGDISRFSTAKGLIAFAGLDPAVNESGKKDSKHLQITKKGNKYLRTSLYLSVTNICHWHPESFISKFVDSKIKDGLSKKAAKVAGCAKLLRLIYSMFTNGTCYSEKE
jgi:transposase